MVGSADANTILATMPLLTQGALHHKKQGKNKEYLKYVVSTQVEWPLPGQQITVDQATYKATGQRLTPQLRRTKRLSLLLI